MSTDNLDIDLTRGTDYVLEVLYTDDSGTPINLTGLTVRISVAWEAYRPKNSAPVAAGGYEQSSAAFGSDGEISFTIPATDTAEMPVSDFGKSGPPMAYQLMVGDSLILAGNVTVNRNIHLELTA